MNEQAVLGLLSEGLYYFKQMTDEIKTELTKPSVLYKPRIYPDGNMWCCILGNMPKCVVGFGKTPYEAVCEFDKNFYNEVLPIKDNK